VNTWERMYSEHQCSIESCKGLIDHHFLDFLPLVDYLALFAQAANLFTLPF